MCVTACNTTCYGTKVIKISHKRKNSGKNIHKYPQSPIIPQIHPFSNETIPKSPEKPT